MLLESAAQVQDSDLLYLWPETREAKNVITKNLPFFVATSFGSSHITAALLSGLDDFDVNSRYGHHGTTALHQAIESGDTALTRVLLDAGADTSIREDRSVSYHSVLYKAIAFGHHAIVELLLSHDPGAALEGGVVYCATFPENESAMRSIVALARHDAQRAERVHEIFRQAVYLGRVSVMKLAMDFGVDIEQRDDDGRTALFIAVKHGRSSAVRFLLENNASMKVRDSSGIACFRQLWVL